MIRVFLVRKKKLYILGYPQGAQWRFRSDCAIAQADLKLRWAHMSKDTFSDFATPLLYFTITVLIMRIKNDIIIWYTVAIFWNFFPFHGKILVSMWKLKIPRKFHDHETLTSFISAIPHPQFWCSPKLQIYTRSAQGSSTSSVKHYSEPHIIRVNK